MRLLGAILLGAVALVVGGACGSDSGGGFAGGGATDGGGATGGTAGDAATGTGGSTQGCLLGQKQCMGQVPQVCEIGALWTSGAPCPFICNMGECVGTCLPGSTQCKFGKSETCGANGEWGAGVDCEFGCESGTCKSTCVAGEFNCYGNQIRQCDPGPPPKWTATGTVCNAASGQKCDAKTGTCVPTTPIGSSTPTGKYYQFAIFKNGASAYTGGFDVTSWGDYIYVNRSSQYLDVYKVTLEDTDGDGLLEPNQHPLNPLATGPVENRKLELVTSYTKTADGAPLGPASTSSLHAQSNDKIYALGPTHNGIISEYVFASKSASVSVQPATATPYMSFLGFGYADGVWYAGNEGARRVYSYHAPTKAWVAEFGFPDLAGSHMDGMEVVISPKTGTQYVYVSDMTSDFIGQYRRDDTAAGGWVQEKLFEYDDTTTSNVEGFGFGALNHFWATSGTYLYELGGGDIQEDLEPCEGGKQVCGDKLPACQTGYYCKAGCCEKGAS